MVAISDAGKKRFDKAGGVFMGTRALLPAL